MEKRNLDFDIEITPDQWEELGRTAAGLGHDQGFSWNAEDSTDIEVMLRPDSAPATWRDRLTDERTYGEHVGHVARFVFNDGRPFARLEPWYDPQPPAVPPDLADQMRGDLESWVRNRWHDLMRESGMHYERGHLS
jgi:hypothetical protein